MPVRKTLSVLSRRHMLATMAGFAASMAFASTTPATANQRNPTMPKIDLDHFVQDCIIANQEAEAQASVREVLAKAVCEPEKLRRSLESLKRAGISVLHRSPTLTILNAVWTPQMNLMPHNHLMWANIGIYSGREDNIFWHKPNGRLAASGAEALFEGDVASLEEDAIHSVTNPLLRFTGGIHIYGGDFFNTARSEWNPETLEEEPSNGEKIRAMFERENQRLGL